MATVSVGFGRWNERQPIMGVLRDSESVTSSGTAQNSTNTGTVDDNCVEIVSSGGDVWVNLKGTAAAGTGYLIPAGGTRTFSAGFGTVVSIIDA